MVCRGELWFSMCISVVNEVPCTSCCSRTNVLRHVCELKLPSKPTAVHQPLTSRDQNSFDICPRWPEKMKGLSHCARHERRVCEEDGFKGMTRRFFVLPSSRVSVIDVPSSCASSQVRLTRSPARNAVFSAMVHKARSRTLSFRSALISCTFCGSRIGSAVVVFPLDCGVCPSMNAMIISDQMIRNLKLFIAKSIPILDELLCLYFVQRIHFTTPFLRRSR